jgi:hypothetical protein
VGLVHSGFVDAVETAEGHFREPRPLRSLAPLRVGPHNAVAYMTRYYDWPFHPSTIVMRREVWRRVGPFDPAWLLADTDWFARAIRRFPSVLLPRHGVLNRRHPGNWSNRVGSARMQSEIFQVVERLIEETYAERRLRQASWRALWRTHARLRLLLTLKLRLRHGQAEAAASIWRTLCRETGWQAPDWMLDQGDRAFRKLALSREGAQATARQSVSPL